MNLLCGGGGGCSSGGGVSGEVVFIWLQIFLRSCDLSVGNVGIVLGLIVRRIIFGKFWKVWNFFKLWFFIWLRFPSSRSIIFVIKFLKN